ncbi:fructose symporter [Lithohypha guttulata]|uniref:Fructose symporter n=1 Tax=Lithohypha guttulata TaxID=1690604 RepID=A0ABR0KAG0_9EURO|nr:fructose symporter [Lithohypha guttulata]
MPTNKEAAQVPQPAAHLDYEKDDPMVPNPDGGFRKQSVASRRMSTADAMYMAKEDMTAVDEEIEDFEQQLKDNPIHAPWLNPKVTLKDPRHFTWLLVAFASMGESLNLILPHLGSAI